VYLTKTKRIIVIVIIMIGKIIYAGKITTSHCFTKKKKRISGGMQKMLTFIPWDCRLPDLTPAYEDVSTG
jgi:hypothetical protein